MTFTSDDLADWREYERVRQSGCYNMLDPNARWETGLSKERYIFVMQNFAALKAAAQITTNGLNP